MGPSVKTHPESKCPELLAQYCDMLLRKTPLSKKLTSEEVEGKLKNVVSGRTNDRIFSNTFISDHSHTHMHTTH